MLGLISVLAVIVLLAIWYVCLWDRCCLAWSDFKRYGYIGCLGRSDSYGHLIMLLFVNFLVIFAILYGWFCHSWAGIVVFAAYVIFWLLWQS